MRDVPKTFETTSYRSTLISDLRDVIFSVPGLAYWRADDIQMMGSQGTLKRMERFVGGDSTTGGDITPTGNLNRPLTIRVTITTSGGYGVGKFNCSFDGGVTQAMSDVTIQSSVPLTGYGTGTSLLFSASSFDINNIFENVSEFWPYRGAGSNIVRAHVDYLNGSRIRYGDWAPAAGTTLPNTVPIVVTEPGGTGYVGDEGQFLPNTNLVIPEPGTTPTYITAIFRQLAIVGAGVERSLCLGSATNKFRIWIRQDGQVTIDNGITRVWPSYTFTKWGNWFRLRAFFSNSSSDMLQIGADSTTFASAGNNSDTTFQLMRSSTEGVNGTEGQQACAEFSMWKGMPTVAEKLLEDVYYTSRYGVGPPIA